MSERESIKVLRECIELQNRKAQDYQNPASNVKQAMHYRRGVDSIFDTMNGKMLRIQSLIEAQVNPTHESLEDSFKDLINYASFAVSYMRGKMEGQDPNRDMFNRPINRGTIPKTLHTFIPSFTPVENLTWYENEQPYVEKHSLVDKIRMGYPIDDQPYVEKHDVEAHGLDPADGATLILEEKTK